MLDWLDFSQLSWQWALVWRIVIGFGVAQVIIKIVSQLPRRTERFLWQFTLTFVMALCLFLWTGAEIHNWGLALFVVVISMVSSYGTFYAWKAIAISQSRNALFTFWDDIIAMLLAFVFLHEAQFITPRIALGVSVSLLALFLLVLHEWWKVTKAETEEERAKQFPWPRFLLYIAIYSVAWGFGYFSQRLWAHESLAIAEFLLPWYGGALVTALLIHLFYHEPQDKGAPALSMRGICLVGVLSVTIFVSMALTIPTYQAPQVVIQPMFFVSEMILPALIGLFIFHERRQFYEDGGKGPLDWVKVFLFGLAALGSLIVGFSFRG